MRISAHMNLADLAERMGEATDEDTAAMRDVLVERFDGMDTADLTDDDWFAAIADSIPCPDVQDCGPFRYASNGEIEIRVDLEMPDWHVEYRLLDDDEYTWHVTPFQRAEFIDENDALIQVLNWLA